MTWNRNPVNQPALCIQVISFLCTCFALMAKLFLFIEHTGHFLRFLACSQKAVSLFKASWQHAESYILNQNLVDDITHSWLVCAADMEQNSKAADRKFADLCAENPFGNDNNHVLCNVACFLLLIEVTVDGRIKRERLPF